MVKHLSVILIGCSSFFSDRTTTKYSATWYDTQPHPKVHREHSTAAFNLYKKGDKLVVINLSNGKSDTVEITDRHTCADTHIDLSKKSFAKIADLKQGRISVMIKKL
jgi:rare lipoprotein A (peptidoglycan hydrolase)